MTITVQKSSKVKQTRLKSSYVPKIISVKLCVSQLYLCNIPVQFSVQYQLAQLDFCGCQLVCH